MVEVYGILFDALIFTLPALIANTVPIYINGLGRMDRGYNFFDGRPILGKNKTIGGLLSAILAGGMIGICIYYYFHDLMGQFPIWIGFVQGFGAMFGDAFGSFFKRRLNLHPGGSLPIIDQIGFVFFAYLFSIPFASFNIIWPLILIPGTFVLHILANIFAYKMGWKEVWW